MDIITNFSQGIGWGSFASKMRALSKDIHLATERPMPHPEYSHLTLLGLFYRNKHICSVTFDSMVPLKDVYDEKGVLTHRGLKTILKYLLTAEFIPNDTATLNMPKAYQGGYFKPEISIDKMRKVFGLDTQRVQHA